MDMAGGYLLQQPYTAQDCPGGIAIYIFQLQVLFSTDTHCCGLAASVLIYAAWYQVATWCKLAVIHCIFSKPSQQCLGATQQSHALQVRTKFGQAASAMDDMCVIAYSSAVHAYICTCFSIV